MADEHRNEPTPRLIAEDLNDPTSKRSLRSRLGRFAIRRRSKNMVTESATKADAVEIDYGPGRPDSFIPGTIEGCPSCPPGGRNLANYEKDLMFARTELEGKKVLDLGAGSEVRFATELKSSGIAAEVVEFSPDFYDPEYLARAQSMYDGEIVAGFGQSLPFDDGSFDRVFAFHVLEHVSPEDCKMIIKETARVLKTGGSATLGTLIEYEGFWGLYGLVWGEGSDEFNAELGEIGATIRKVDIPEEIIPPKKIHHSLHGYSSYKLSYNLVVEKRSPS